MAWLWSSWEEFVDAVAPKSADSPGLLGLAKHNPWFETEQSLFEAVREVKSALQSLYDLGYKGDDHSRPPDDPIVIEKANGFVIDLIHAGEELLLYHKRLAKNKAAYGFLHSHDLCEHWERYSATRRIAREIDQLVKDTDELLQGYQEMVS